jgi:hypothetical protein
MWCFSSDELLLFIFWEAPSHRAPHICVTMDASLYWASNPGPYDIFNRVAAGSFIWPVLLHEHFSWMSQPVKRMAYETCPVFTRAYHPRIFPRQAFIRAEVGSPCVARALLYSNNLHIPKANLRYSYFPHYLVQK